MLEIAKIHTYAVGKTGVLVHNSNCNWANPVGKFNNGAPSTIGIVAQNGTKINGYSIHGIDRAIGDGGKRAGTNPKAILDAFKKTFKNIGWG